MFVGTLADMANQIFIYSYEFSTVIICLLFSFSMWIVEFNKYSYNPIYLKFLNRRDVM